MKSAPWLVALAALVAAPAWAATAPPSAGVWNIAASGKAASSGDLEFRVTSIDGSDPVEISVPVIAGSSEQAMARTIRRVMSAQLPRDRYSVELGEGGNVMVSDPRGRPNFTIELLNSDIDNVRVAVQSVTPAATPTVPAQSAPAERQPVTDPAPTTPGSAPGDGSPPSSAAPPPITPPKGDTIPVPDPVRVPAPSTTVPSPAQSVPPPPAVPAPAPAAPPGQAPAVPGDNSAPTPMTPPPRSSTSGAGPAAAPPPGS